MQPKLLNDYPDELFLGYDCIGQPVSLVKPEWQCNWYWGVRTLISNDFIKKYHTGLLHELKYCIITDYEDTWLIDEYMLTLKHLQTTAEVFGRGGSYITANPCKELLIDETLVHKINYKLIPKIVDEMYQVLLKPKVRK